ncbi:unnamed protein product, partial [Discosporangium mesarthrocarpum]
MFRSLSLRGKLELTKAELEMGLSLIDGLDLTKHEVHTLLVFLDRNHSATVDPHELDLALREFRILRRDEPSFGDGPRSLLDPQELDALAEVVFHLALSSAP